MATNKIRNLFGKVLLEGGKVSTVPPTTTTTTTAAPTTTTTTATPTTTTTTTATPLLPYSTTKAYYKFEQNLTDSSGNNLTATKGTSVVYTASGKIDYGISMQQGASASYNILSNVPNGFTGTDDITITNCAGITMGGWFYKKTGGGNNQGMIYMGSTDAKGGFGIYIPTGTNNDMYGLYGGLSTFACGTLTDNTWHHVVFTLDNTKVGNYWYGRVYLDGVLQATKSDLNPRQPRQTFQTQIGCMGDNGSFTNQQFYGDMDEIFVNVGTILTGTQILALYNQQK